MAEYREFHCPYGDDFEGGDECDRCEQYELCMETPTADVIERSKIDMTIEELQARVDMFYKIGDSNNACTTISALEILKRNIGE